MSFFLKLILTTFLFFYSYKVSSETQNSIEIKNPIFTTKGIDGNPYEIKAERGFQNKDSLDLFIIEAKLRTSGNVWIYLQADRGSFDQLNGIIKLENNIIAYSDVKQKIFADTANINTNNKEIILIDNVKYQDSNILITSNKSIINSKLSNIEYSGNVKSKIIK